MSDTLYFMFGLIASAVFLFCVLAFARLCYIAHTIQQERKWAKTDKERRAIEQQWEKHQAEYNKLGYFVAPALAIAFIGQLIISLLTH